MRNLLVLTLLVLSTSTCARIVRPVSPPAPLGVQSVRVEVDMSVDEDEFSELGRYDIPGQMEKAMRGSVADGTEFHIVLTITHMHRVNANWRARSTKMTVECALRDSKGLRKTYLAIGESADRDRYHASRWAAQTALERIVAEMRRSPPHRRHTEDGTK